MNGVKTESCPTGQAYIALGSNVGEREETLREAVQQLQNHPMIEVERCSSIYETDPIGYTDQPTFLNMVLQVRTELAPLPLLHYMQKIEGQLGRIRNIRWGPRTIDLDLLMADDINMNMPELTLPHPRMFERAFVLIPLWEIVSNRPVHGKETIRSALEKLNGKEGIRFWKTFIWQGESAHSGS